MANVGGRVTIKPSELNAAIAEELAALNTAAVEAVSKAAEKTAKDTAKELKANSPVRADNFKRKYPPGSYAKSWTAEESESNLGAKTYVVHNKKHYALTHLLEHGHIIKATGRRSEAFPHIGPAEQKAIEEFTNEVERMKL